MVECEACAVSASAADPPYNFSRPLLPINDEEQNISFLDEYDLEDLSDPDLRYVAITKDPLLPSQAEIASSGHVIPTRKSRLTG